MVIISGYNATERRKRHHSHLQFMATVFISFYNARGHTPECAVLHFSFSTLTIS